MFRASKRFPLRKLLDNENLVRCINTRAPCNQSQEISSQYSSQEPLSWLKGSYAKRFPPLFHPLPGLKLPPYLPDFVDSCPTKITELPNGLTIASEDSPGPAACIGLFVDCGSIYETEQSTGFTHLLERMAFKSTKNRSHLRIVREFEGTGGNVSASASREQMAYSYDTLKTCLPEAIELLVDCIRNPVFLESEVKEQLTKVKTEIKEISNNPQQFLLESLNSIGYSGALGKPLMAPDSVLDRIDGSVLENFYFENFTAKRMVLAASGVDHEQLLAIVEPLLYDLHSGPPTEVPKSLYVGGDFRYRADSQTHVALAFEVPGGWRQEKDATALTVLQTLMGGGGSFSVGGPGKGMHSRLYLRVLNEHQQVDSFSAASSVYNDTGLFGIQSTTGSDYVSEAVEIAVDELLAVTTLGQVTEVELHRAKNATKSAVLMNLESRMIVTEDIGRQILTYGCRKPVEHFLKAVDELTLEDLAALALKILSSPLTMCSWGDVDRVPSYDSVCQYFQKAN
ncbi:mitochondrial-processing peptidase subunit alpha-like isoform X2 [Tasmannia lanceolata]|uniref:mitochondrial-processing peptidase subunit alpha-like isoform X2 n=1 Tax=Tasmannia lanceolata TaxID=3420 RepID=UPI004062B824